MPSSIAALYFPKGPEPILTAEPLSFDGQQFVGHPLRFAHEQGGIEAHAFAIAAAAQTAHGLAAGLAKNIPGRQVDPADGVRDLASAALPEGVLVELFAHAFGLKGVLAFEERAKDGERRPHEVVVRENTAPALQAAGVSRDQSVNAVFRTESVGPSAFGGASAQAESADLMVREGSGHR
jgi:hypothetical protein